MRGRKPLPPAEVVDVHMDEVAVARAGQAATEVDQSVRDAADRFLEGRAYSRLAFIEEARFYVSHGDMSYFQAGLRLICIKEREPHGDFLDIVENQMNMSIRTAQRLMQTAARLSRPKLAHHAEKLLRLGHSKMADLMVEDDDTLSAFAEGGTVAGLTFDKYDAMSLRDSRRALREQDTKLDVKDKIIKQKDQKINELSEILERLASAAPDEREKAQLDELGKAMQKADIAMLSALGVAIAVTEKPATGAAELAALQAVEFMLRRLVDVCMKHSFSIDLTAELDPFWYQAIKDAARRGDDVAQQKRAAREELGRSAT